MFRIEDYVMYKRDVCKVVDIQKQFRNDLDYYVLISVKDPSLKIEIPTNSPLLHSLIEKEEIEKIIQQIPKIELIDVEEKMLEQEYKKLLSSGTHEDLIKIIKTTYVRNQKRLENKKKIGDKDNRYFEKAEEDLYQEFGIVLNMTLEETKEYIKRKVIEAIN